MNQLFINFIDCCVELEYHLCTENLIPDSFVTAVEVEIDGSVTVETVGNTAMGEVSSIADDNREGGSSVEPNDKQDQHDNMTQDSSGGITIPTAIPTVSVVSVEEPYVGQEFGSEAAAHAFYNAYATEVGFIVRVSKLSRSRRDGTAIGRTLVCNKEGFRMADKREKIVRQRAETRVGCRAMIMVRKLSSGKWVVAKFVKEHTHPLTPGKGRRDFYYEQYPVSFFSFTTEQLYILCCVKCYLCLIDQL